MKALISGISMKPEFLEVKNALEECPKCGKHSLAHQSSSYSNQLSPSDVSRVSAAEVSPKKPFSL